MPATAETTTSGRARPCRPRGERAGVVGQLEHRDGPHGDHAGDHTDDERGPSQRLRQPRGSPRRSASAVRNVAARKAHVSTARVPPIERRRTGPRRPRVAAAVERARGRPRPRRRRSRAGTASPPTRRRRGRRTDGPGASVGANLRKANAEPRATMPRPARRAARTASHHRREGLRERRSRGTRPRRSARRGWPPTPVR